MRRFLIILITLFGVASFTITAQNMSVKSFILAETDMTANLEGTIRYDQNGDKCALIRIQTTQKGFSFDLGQMPFIGDIQYKPGEIWIYVPYGVKRMTIRHPQLGTLSDYTFPVPIEKARTYIMDLVAANVITIVEQQTTQQWLIFDVTPKEALVELDGQLLENTEGRAKKFVQFGTYRYKVSAPQYHSKEGTVTVSDPENKTVETVELLPSFGTLNILTQGNLAGAVIYIDNDNVGTVPAALLRVQSGSHTLKLMKPKYKTYVQQIDVKDGQGLTLTPVLEPNFTKVKISCPEGGEIWANGQKLGNSPWTGDLEYGSYSMEVRKPSHRTAYQNMEFTELSDKEINLSSPIPIYGSLSIDCSPDAKVTIDGAGAEDSPVFMSKILIGEHTVMFEKEGYASKTMRVNVTEGNTFELKATLEKKTVAAVPSVQGSAKQTTPQNNTYPSSGVNGTENGHEYVDLGLGVMWATCNVGATKPEDYGEYFAWGETNPKSEYYWENLKYHTKGDSFENVKLSKYVTNKKYGTVDNKTRLDICDDAARANWGENWRMPTKDEFQELIDKCVWTWTTQGGHNGYKVTSKINGNSIFLPAAGHRELYSGFLLLLDKYGQYWSSSLFAGYSIKAENLTFHSSNVRVSEDYRYEGYSIRPVMERERETVQSTPSSSNMSNTSEKVYSSTEVDEGPTSGVNGIENGHEYVNLGLSVMWATCNVGANKPEEYGDYFAWGETSPKSNYNWENLEYRIKGDSYENVTFSKYVKESEYGTVDNKFRLDLTDDVAHANWGGSWRMPTRAEQDELREKCTWTWTTQGGYIGYKVTSKINGNTIFLPAAGYREGSRLYDLGDSGNYLSSSLHTINSRCAYRLYFDSGKVDWSNSSRYYGRSVRPVCP